MKRSSLIVVLVFLLVLTSGVAFSAESGAYMSAKVGGGSLEDIGDSVGDLKINCELDAGLALAVAAGYDFVPFRVEGEFSYQKNDFDKVEAKLNGEKFKFDAEGDMTSYTLMVNGYYDIRNSSPMSLFFGAGLGGARLEINDFNIKGSGLDDESDSDTVFAYQITAGIGYAVNEKVVLDFTYRYFDTAEDDYDGSHNAYVGLRMRF